MGSTRLVGFCNETEFLEEIRLIEDISTPKKLGQIEECRPLLKIGFFILPSETVRVLWPINAQIRSAIHKLCQNKFTCVIKAKTYIY